MAVAHGNCSSGTKTCNCYTVSGLVAPILETSQSSRLEDHYILGNQLGLGQFGVIRMCLNIFTGEKLACKSIPKDHLVTPEGVHSIKLEIEIMYKLSGHPNVVELKAVYEEENYVHLVMELCAGGELFHQLEKSGHFPEPNARVLFRHLMEVVMYCHANGVVHRDLKPENILLATRSASSPIKLADFGLATYIKPGQFLTGTVGSPFYIAPEVLTGGYTQAADVWSAGVILYILLSGMPPFWGKTKSRIFDAVRATYLRFPSEPWDCVSASAKELIVGMLCRDPKQRLTASQVLEHSWITDCTEQYPGSPNHGSTGLGGCSFSIPLDQDFSFGSNSPISNDAALDFSTPAFSCKSSFSSFLIDATPCIPQGGCSFHSCGKSGCREFSSPIQSMWSFAFFIPSSPKDVNTEADPIQRETSFGNLFVNGLGFSRDNTELDQNTPEINKVEATTNSRASGIHGKRNRTIGLDEHEQLDIMVIESIIRWASCHLPAAAPLRSSLVC